MRVLTVSAHGDESPVNETLNTIYKYGLLITPLTIVVLMTIYFVRYGRSAKMTMREDIEAI
ncbi:MAG: hypothetical protein ACXAE3_02805 [Candidatus Kariarchaeaceae archaeon]|jgi:hypothetical protein